MLSCAVATCSGAIKVTGVEHLTGKKATAVSARAKRHKKPPKKTTRTIVLASGFYALAAGQTEVVTLTLSPSAASLLKQLSKLQGTVSLTATGASTPSVTKPVTFTAPKPKPKPKHKAKKHHQ